MSEHKCDGCRYKGEYQDMGFRPLGVCNKETNLVTAIKAYNAATCPYYSEVKTPYDAKIEEAARILKGEERPAYLPQLYKIEGVDLAEPETWTKVNPILPPVAVEPEPLLSPEKQAEISEALANFAKIINETLTPYIDRLTEIIKGMAEKLTVFIPQMTKTLEEIINLYPNKRVKYLAYHGKRRTRKKNINRIKKYFERLARP